MYLLWDKKTLSALLFFSNIFLSDLCRIISNCINKIEILV